MTDIVRNKHIQYMQESLDRAGCYWNLYVRRYRSELTGPSYLQAAAEFIHAAECIERILEMDGVRVPDSIEQRIGMLMTKIFALQGEAYLEADARNTTLIMKEVNLLENEQRTDFRKEQEQ